MITNEIRELAEDFANKVKAILAADLPIDLGGLVCLQKNGPRVLKRVDGWELGIQAYVAAILLGHLGGTASVDGGEVVYRVGDHTIYIRDWIRKWITSPGPDSIAFKVAAFIRLQSRPRKPDPEVAKRGADELARELSVGDDERQLVDRYFADLITRAEAALTAPPQKGKSIPVPGIELEDLQKFEDLSQQGRVYFWARAEFINNAGQLCVFGGGYRWDPLFSDRNVVAKQLLKMATPTPKELVAAFKYLEKGATYGATDLWRHVCVVASKARFWDVADKNDRERAWRSLMEMLRKGYIYYDPNEVEYLAARIDTETWGLLRELVDFLKSKEQPSFKVLEMLLKPLGEQALPDLDRFRSCIKLWGSLARGKVRKYSDQEWTLMDGDIQAAGRSNVAEAMKWILANSQAGDVVLPSGSVASDTMFNRMVACAGLLLKRLA